MRWIQEVSSLAICNFLFPCEVGLIILQGSLQKTFPPLNHIHRYFVRIWLIVLDWPFKVKYVMESIIALWVSIRW